MDVSVVVCTYNRARLLRVLLESLGALEMPAEVEWELVLVDNNSKDDTRRVVDGFAARLPVRYQFEKRQGKAHALNTALAESRGSLLVFVDDDVVVPRSWLGAFVEAASGHRGFAWFGGRVKPDWTAGVPPRWYRQETAPALNGFFVNYDLGEQSRAYTANDKLPLGASLAVRREVFDRVGGFRGDLGPRGRLRGVGDETELLDRAVAVGLRGYYVAEAPVFHHVAAERSNLSALLNYGFGKGVNQYRMGTEGGRRGSLFVAASQLLRAVLQVLKGRGDRARICLINVGIELGRLQGGRKVDRG